MNILSYKVSTAPGSRPKVFNHPKCGISILIDPSDSS
jgi:hypothetical protein